MKSIDNVGVTFVNAVVGQGTLNGVVNIALGTFLFTPGDDDKVDPDLVTTARLRMDQLCARQLHEALGKLLELIDKTEPEAGATRSSTNGVAAPAQVKPN